MNYYIAGYPVSDELYHHGIKGQKWYVRRYQNDDGTYTALGKIHYGIGKAGKAFGSGVANVAKATGKAIKKTVDHKVDNVKKKHPWMMSDEELKAQTERTKLENAYLSEINKKKEASTSRGQKLARTILESTATTLASKAVDAAAKKLFTEKEKPVRDLEDVLNDSKATASEIKSAYERFKNKKDLESYKSDKAMRDYKPTDDALDRVDQMSKSELDNYNAWRSSRYGKANGSIEQGLRDREKSRAAQEAKEEAERQKIQEREAEIRQRGIDNIEREHREREERKAREEAFDREARRPDKLAEERIKAQTKYRFEERARNAEAKREQSSDFRETVRSNAEKKRSAVAFVDNLFKEKAKDPRFGSYYSDYKNTSEYRDAVKKAKELVEQNKSITVGSLFYD